MVQHRGARHCGGIGVALQPGREGARHGTDAHLDQREFWFYLFYSFIGMGIFNGIATWVVAIIRPRGFTPTETGKLGALMLGTVFWGS